MKLINKIFSKNKEKSKLNIRDRQVKFLGQKLGKPYINLTRSLNSGEDNTKDFAKFGAIVGSTSSIPSELIRSGGKLSPKKLARKSLLGAGIGVVTSVPIGKACNYAYKKSPNLRKESERISDLLDVAEGKKKEADYIKKHYKN